jgi:arsenite methyltransferase
MREAAHDQWASWVLRPDNDLESMHPMRDRLLANANVGAGDVVLDVGTGSGLIAFEALELVGEDGFVILSDVSESLLEHCQEVAAERGVTEQCRFVLASAADLAELPDGSVDVVTTRSVLIYVKDKARAFREFFRVLRSGGRLSIFEPINSFDHPWPPNRFLGYDVGPVEELARKVMAVYDRLQPPDDPMLDFDERDLLAHAERAGFGKIRMVLEAEVGGSPWTAGLEWDAFLRLAGNPRVPPLEDLLDEALTREEKERFCAHLRPLVQRGEGEGRFAKAFLWAVKA